MTEHPKTMKQDRAFLSRILCHAFLLPVLVLLALSHPALAARKKCLDYEPAVVTLKGKISRHQAYGPPNFGDTPDLDEKVVYWFLDLTRPICVNAREDGSGLNEEARDVRHLHIVYMKGYPEGDGWIGRPVAITGTLYHAHTAFHRTPVLITAQKTEKLPDARGEAGKTPAKATLKSKAYRDLTVDQAAEDVWAPQQDSAALDQYQAKIRMWSGLTGKEKIGDLTDDELARLMAAQKRAGGWAAGTATSRKADPSGSR